MKSFKNFVMLVVVMLFVAGNVFAAESFSLAWSEYPSWSVFGVCEMLKFKEVDGKWVIDSKGDYLLDGKAGKQGIIERKWDIDIVLQEKDYDTCISYYATSQCDAVCITTLDALPIVLSRKSVVIMPTSTSFGADALIVGKDINDITQLKGKEVYGFSKGVSEYCFVRNLEILGQKEKDYKFVHNDPGVAATAFQQYNEKYTGIVVWNPFVMSTLANRKDSHVGFNSETIPGEIIDSIFMSKKSLERAAGKNAACAIADAYYTLAKVLAQKETQDQTLVALGKKFSNLNAEQMKTVVRQTRFYATPEMGISFMEGGVVFPWKRNVENTSDLFTNAGFNPKSSEVTDKTLKELMPFVVKFCIDKEMTPKAPVISYGKAEEKPFDIGNLVKIKNVEGSDVSSALGKEGVISGKDAQGLFIVKFNDKTMGKFSNAQLERVIQMLFDSQYMKAVAEKNKK